MRGLRPCPRHPQRCVGGHARHGGTWSSTSTGWEVCLVGRCGLMWLDVVDGRVGGVEGRRFLGWGAGRGHGGQGGGETGHAPIHPQARRRGPRASERAVRRARALRGVSRRDRAGGAGRGQRLHPRRADPQARAHGQDGALRRRAPRPRPGPRRASGPAARAVRGDPGWAAVVGEKRGTPARQSARCRPGGMGPPDPNRPLVDAAGVVQHHLRRHDPAGDRRASQEALS